MNTLLDSTYYPQLIQEILSSINNNYIDNYDHYRFGPIKKEKSIDLSGSARKAFRENLNKLGYFNASNITHTIEKIGTGSWLTYFSYLYDLLADRESKDLLIKIVAYRLLGHRKVKLPLSSSEMWKKVALIESKQDLKKVIEISFMKFRLSYTDLSFLDLPIKLYYSSLGIYIDFVFKQYELERPSFYIGAERDDVVLDGGGCFGDTALYFANKVGSQGSVHTFEFIPDNISIFKTNVDLNPNLEPIINLDKRPLWSVSGLDVFYTSNGPASRVEFEKFTGHDGQTKTISIDDYAQEKDLDRVNFIKLDIEGAELHALKGSKNTISKFKPKLAVALYHNVEDFYEIPKFLAELNLGYKFYLLHATIHSEETMLFASID